jgi:tetratricopeptide (TPR) repeat protein
VFFAGRSERKQSAVARTVGAIVAVTWCSLASLAMAGEGDKSVARAHYETATRLYDVRDYADALKEYKAAYVAKPDAAFLFNIGQCYRKLDKNAEALDFFQQFLKKAPPDDPNRALVEARIRNIEAGLNSDYDPFDKSGAAKGSAPAVKAAPSFAGAPVPLAKTN